MKSMKFYFCLSVILSLLIMSCAEENKKAEDSSNDVIEDKSNIQATLDTNLNCIMQVRDGDFFQAFIKFLNLQKGNIGNEIWVDNLSNKLDNIADLDWIEKNNRFSLLYFNGNYAWNSTTQLWTRSTNNNQVTVNFPSEKSQLTNNCVFKISDYKDAPFQISNEQTFLPTLIKANLLKNNAEIMSLDFVCSYNTSGFPVPIDATITLFLKPFTYKVKIKRLTLTQFEVNAELYSGSDCSTTLYSKISIANSDYENLNLDRDLNNIQLEYSKGDIKVNGTWDAKTFNKLSDPTVDQLNSTINFTVNYKQQKIGDLRFKDIGSKRQLFIYYKDNTYENTSLYYDTFYSDFKAIAEPYFGDVFQ